MFLDLNNHPLGIVLPLLPYFPFYTQGYIILMGKLKEKEELLACL